MSLLDRINERNMQKAQTTQTGQQALEAEAAAPDAVQQANQQRRDYGGAIAAGPDQDVEDEQATPEEQEMFTTMEKDLAEVVYGEQASDGIIQAVMAAQDPVEGIGQTANDIVQQMQQKYPDVTDDVLLAIGETAVEQVHDLVSSAQPDVVLNDDQMAEAFSIALSEYMKGNPNAMDPDMQEYMAQEAPQQI